VDAGASTAVAGLTAIEVSVTELTFTAAAPVTPLRVALIFADPGATPVTMLTGPTVATAVLSDAQVTSRVMTCVLESVNDPVAVSGSFVAGAMVRPAGVTETETIWALVTSRVTEALAVPSAAAMVTTPGVKPRASPLLPILATPASEELQVAWVVRSRVLPSLKVPTAENCSLVVSAIVTLPGVIAIEARSAAFTLAEALPLIVPEAAVMVTVPRFRAVTRPLTVIEATLVFDELQVTMPVTSCVLPSENVPVAVNCCKVPSGRDAFAGVTAIDVKVALVTVSTALDETLPEVAVMFATPGASPFASPGAPFTLMPATEGLAEAHCTNVVRFCVVPSVKVPVAANWTVVPCAIDTVAGVTARELNTALVTLSVELAEMLPEAAEIDEVPSAIPTASPGVPFALMPATAGFVELHCTEVVRFCVLPSVKVPVAVN